MRIAVLGTGVVGRSIGSRLVALGHTVTMGSRTADNPDATAWAVDEGAGAAHATFADAARAGDLLFNCTAGAASLEVLASIDPTDIAGKILVDVANPLDLSGGFPPTLTISNTDSLAERIQRTHPDVRVVKTLNTVTASVMVDPGVLDAPHHIFLSGDDAEAKHAVTGLLAEIGWPPASVVDLGDITSARGTEMYLGLWVRLYAALGTGQFNIAVVR